MKRTLAAIGGFFTALLTALCPFCLVAFIGLGAGFTSALSQLKPVFILMNIAAIIYLWYFTYRKPKSCRKEKEACSTTTTVSRKIIFWLVVAVSLALHLYTWLFGVIEF